MQDICTSKIWLANDNCMINWKDHVCVLLKSDMVNVYLINHDFSFADNFEKYYLGRLWLWVVYIAMLYITDQA